MPDLHEVTPVSHTTEDRECRIGNGNADLDKCCSGDELLGLIQVKFGEGSGLQYLDRRNHEHVTNTLERLLFESARNMPGKRPRMTDSLAIGGVTRTIEEWAAIANLKRSTIQHRINKGMQPLDALMNRDNNGQCLCTPGHNEADELLERLRKQSQAHVQWRGGNRVIVRISGDVVSHVGFSERTRVLVAVGRQYVKQLLVFRKPAGIGKGNQLYRFKRNPNGIYFHSTFTDETIDVLFGRMWRTNFYSAVSIVDLGHAGEKAIALDCSDVCHP